MVRVSHLLSVVSVLATAFAAPAAKNATIDWKDCPKDIISKLPVKCGSVDVPLDYTDKSAGTLQLNMVKVPAVKKPSKGSIMLNFGGPGEEAQATLGLFSYVLQALSGGHYDLVAFDPRGTVKSLPFTCYNNTLDLMTYRSYTSIFPKGDDEALLGKLWARGKINAQSCADMQPKNGQLIGTAFTARDIKTVANMLDSDGKIRYWGFSYGTTLGATLVSMFPNEVDKVVLDGVQNPHEYYNAYADFQEWTQSDDVLAGIFHYCILNADQCPLAKHGRTGRELEEKVKQLVEDLRTHPVPLGPIIIDDSLVHLQLASSLYATQTWPLVTTALDLLLDKKYDDKFLGQYLGIKVASDASFLEQATRVPQSLSGIHCLDRKARTNSYADFSPAVQQLSKSSWAMGGASIALSMNCAQWMMQPKERYGGDFRVKTKTGVLLVGNKYDGHTPMRSAHNVSAGFQGSQVLEVDGYGHTSTVLPSKCTLEKVSHYWITGELPKKGTVCDIDAPPFSNVTWDQVIEKSGALKIDKRDTMGHLATPAMFPWMKKYPW